VLKAVIVTVAIIGVVYLAICLLAYLFQEKIIFFPEKLASDQSFVFPDPYKELFITTGSGVKLHGLLFSTPGAKGLIFYLHGNAGSVNGWGEVASTYLRLEYDVFILDYRGYGKSEGNITSEAQLIQDVQDVYAHFLKTYEQRNIVVLGYSLGTGLAAKIAAANAPRMLILQAPYSSLTDMMRHSMSFLPTFLLKYKLDTHDILSTCQMPIVVFHGDQDEVIPYSQSLKLQALLKPGDTLITLRGVGHNGMTYEPMYLKAISAILVGTDR
jgi:pimeloyl-ACP methyl ester carboxylesterase